jgi:hypothetical protein
MSKVITRWLSVNPGDIVSFKYKNKKSGRDLTHSVLILSKNAEIKTKEGKKRYLIGLKIEESNRPLIPADTVEKFLLEIGEIELVDAKNKIYGLKLETGKKSGDVQLKRLWRDLKPLNKSNNLYRTYDWLEAKKSIVYKEPIKLSSTLREALESKFEYES